MSNGLNLSSWMVRVAGERRAAECAPYRHDGGAGSPLPVALK